MRCRVGISGRFTLKWSVGTTVALSFRVRDGSSRVRSTRFFRVGTLCGASVTETPTCPN